MSNYKHNLLLSACHSGVATTQECEQMSYAASMWACGEHKITEAEVMLAETVLARSNVANSDKDELAEFTEEIDPSDGENTVRITVTSGRNIGRAFLVKKTDAGFIRGLRTFSSLAAAAGGYA